MISTSGTTVQRRAISLTIAATVAGCADLTVEGAGALNRAVSDLLKAHAWRAARLVGAFDLIANAACPPQRERALATIVDDVIDGFAPG